MPECDAWSNQNAASSIPPATKAWVVSNGARYHEPTLQVLKELGVGDHAVFEQLACARFPPIENSTEKKYSFHHISSVKEVGRMPICIGIVWRFFALIDIDCSGSFLGWSYLWPLTTLSKVQCRQAASSSEDPTCFNKTLEVCFYHRMCWLEPRNCCWFQISIIFVALWRSIVQFKLATIWICFIPG